MTESRRPPEHLTLLSRFGRWLTRLERAARRGPEAGPLRWWIRAAVVTLLLVAGLYVLGLDVGWTDWLPTAGDGAWRCYDDVPARVSPWATLLALAAAYAAHRVHRAAQWWKRAEWALDELPGSRMAPTADRTMFDAVVAQRYSRLLREVLHGDPTAARPPRHSTGRGRERPARVARAVPVPQGSGAPAADGR